MNIIRVEPQTVAQVSFDPSNIEVTRSGVPNYYWPIRLQELMESARSIVAAYREALAGPLREGDVEARLAYTVTSLIFMELQGMFAAKLLAARCRHDGIQPQLPASAAPELRAEFFGEDHDYWIVKVLRGGVRRPRKWRRLVRPLGDIVRPDFFRRRSIETANMESDTITVTPCDLTRKHARKLGIRPTYVPLYEWFYPPTPEELRESPLKSVSPTIRNRLLETLEDTFLSLGAARLDMRREIIGELIDETTAWARFYLERIRQRPERLPRRLWIGSSGVIWSRILAEAVHMNGGEVVGHDHAHGANYSEDTLIPFNELQAKDVFVTYTQAHADLYRRVGPKLQIGPTMPQVEHVGTAEKREPAKAAMPALEPHTVLYVPSILTTGRVGAMPQMPPIMAYDWQARLITTLQELGLEVTQKPHPQSPVPQAPVFEREFGVETAHGRFEDIMDRYDVLLFDFAPQTCFGSALRSSMPIVLIDFGITTYKSDFGAMLQKRCAIVPGRFDEDNRAQIDPGALAHAIGRARFLNDTSFADAVIAL